jgi:hypothetical protein
MKKRVELKTSNPFEKVNELRKTRGVYSSNVIDNKRIVIMYNGELKSLDTVLKELEMRATIKMAQSG